MIDQKNIDIKVNREGNFYQWKRILDVESRIDIDHGPGTMSGGDYSPLVPGVNMAQLLHMHPGKKVRIILEVVEES